MNANFIKKDGFSNPETKRLFEERCDDHTVADEPCDSLCGLCRHAFFLNPPDVDWVLCLNEEGST